MGDPATDAVYDMAAAAQARITELEAVLVATREAAQAALAAERARGDRLAERLKKIRKLPPLYVRPSGGKDYHKCFFLAADPEGGPTDG